MLELCRCPNIYGPDCISSGDIYWSTTTTTITTTNNNNNNNNNNNYHHDDDDYYYYFHISWHLGGAVPKLCRNCALYNKVLFDNIS